MVEELLSEIRNAGKNNPKDNDLVEINIFDSGLPFVGKFIAVTFVHKQTTMIVEEVLAAFDRHNYLAISFPRKLTENKCVIGYPDVSDKVCFQMMPFVHKFTKLSEPRVEKSYSKGIALNIPGITKFRGTDGTASLAFCYEESLNLLTHFIVNFLKKCNYRLVYRETFMRKYYKDYSFKNTSVKLVYYEMQYDNNPVYNYFLKSEF